MRFYRFRHPQQDGFPKEIELFSRITLEEPLDVGQRIVPVPLSGGLSSLSAILLDDDYYNLLKEGRQSIDGISVLAPEWLILFKMKARIDLVRRSREAGDVDSRDLKKHLRDVFRLWEYVDPEARVAVSFPIEADIKEFFDTSDITSQQLKQIGIDEPVELIVEDLKRIYDLAR